MLKEMKAQIESDILAIEFDEERLKLSAMRIIIVKAIEKKEAQKAEEERLKAEQGGLWQRVSSFFSAEKGKDSSLAERDKIKMAKTENIESLFSDDED